MNKAFSTRWHVAAAAVAAVTLLGPGAVAAHAAPPALNYPCERIAVSSDGNYHDRDDIGASAMALALLAERGQQSRLVHWDYNSHLGSSTASWERDMVTATEGTADLVDVRDVRSSNGDVERRPVIATRVVIGGVIAPIELSLTNRDEMGFRMLLGREALRRRFFVEPGRSFLGGGDAHTPPE